MTIPAHIAITYQPQTRYQPTTHHGSPAMTSPLTLFDSKDHAGRLWKIEARTHNDQLIVWFVCWRANGRSKALDQIAAYSADGWDMQRWFPRSPAPVPEVILEAVERQLKELVRQQQSQIQQEGLRG